MVGIVEVYRGCDVCVALGVWIGRGEDNCSDE